MTKWVIDPSGTDCYGKYEGQDLPERVPESEAVEVTDLSGYAVVEWRYEDIEPPDLSNPVSRKDAFLQAGADAIANRDTMDANADIPQEVVDFADNVLRMNYLVYVHLAGESHRIQSFEDRFFDGS